MDTFQIRLFGKVALQQGNKSLLDLPAKALELLCYLLLYRARAHTREALSTLLWPEASGTLSQKYLRQTLWQLQTTLEQYAGKSEGEGLLTLASGWVSINPQVDWVFDVDTFEQAYALCCDVAGQDLSEQQAKTLDAAVDLYQGDLLETWYQDWCIYERERLQLICLAMLEKLMGYCEARQRYTKGIVYGQAILRYDRARECTHRQLMRLYYRAGDRTTALRQYERCVVAMAREFNLPPAHETTTLYEQLRNNQLTPLPLSAPVQYHPRSAAEVDPLLNFHKQLEQIQSSLSNFQQQIHQELYLIKQGLSHYTAAHADQQSLYSVNGVNGVNGDR